MLLLFVVAACGSVTEGTVVPLPHDSGAAADARSDADAGETALPEADGAFVYAARRGVSTPWFIPVTSDGPGAAIRLGPRRGAGYGLGEGDVSYPDVTPDGARVVVVFYPMATPSSSGTGGSILFALALTGKDADAPVRIASAEQLHALERTYSDGWMAYVDGNSVYAARLDGSDADAPIHVATAPDGKEIDGLRWAGQSKTLTYTERNRSTGQGRQVFMATVDASGSTSPTPLHTAVGPAEWVADALPGGRVVVSGPDDRLHVVSLDQSAPPAVLTPEGVIAGYVGSTPDGGRIVVELRVTWKEERELVSVATDGSEADAPMTLTPEPIRSLSTQMSTDGSAVAWVGKSPEGSWAAFRTGLNGPAPAEGPRITDWGALRLHITGFDVGADALVGSREDGAVLRYTGLPGAPSSPLVLAVVEDVVNFSIPWPALSADGAQVIYDANTPTGWHSWVLPLAGGDPVQLPGPWYRDLLTPRGVLYHEYVAEEALFVADLQGARAALGPWHDSVLYGPRLVDDGKTVLYGCDTPTPGFYAAPTTPAASPGGFVRVMPAATEPDQWQEGAYAVDLKRVAAGHLVRRHGTTLESWALDGSHAAAGAGLVLAEGVEAPVALDGAVAVYVVGSEVLSRRVDGDGAPTLVMSLKPGAKVEHLSVLSDSGRVLVGVRSQAAMDLLVAAVDGTDVGSPGVVATALPGWFLAVAHSATGEHVFTVHSVEATAVPHPDLLLAAPTGLGGGALTGVAHPLAPAGFLLWGTGWTFEGGELPHTVTSADGVHAILSGPEGLYAARADGSEAAAPRLLGSAKAALGAALSPDGLQLLLREDQQVVVAQLDGAGSQRTLTTTTGGLTDGAWTPDGERVVFLAAASATYGAPGELRVVAADAQSASGTVLHAPAFAIGGLAGLTPDGTAAVVESTQGLDHSLYLISLDGTHASEIPPAITPVDDVGERFVGFL